MTRYYIKLDQYNQIHAYKTTPNGTVHINVTNNHYNELNHDWAPTEEMVNSSEEEFTRHRDAVIAHLDGI